MDAKEKVPSWSPNGERISFGSTDGVTSAIWTIDVQGGNPQRISKGAVSNNLWNIWAPGCKILFQNPNRRNFSILDPETGEETLLVKNENEGALRYPKYSPDGKKVAINWDRQSYGGLYIISLETNSQTRISNEITAPIGWTASRYPLTAPAPLFTIKAGEKAPLKGPSGVWDY